MNLTDISRTFITRRKELGMTQKTAAELSGLSVITIKRIEAGKQWMGLKQFVTLAGVYGMALRLENRDISKPV